MAATLWGGLGPSYAWVDARTDASQLEVVTIRAVAAAIFLISLLTVGDGRPPRVERRDGPRVIFFGLITVTLFYPALLMTFEKTSVSVGAMLLYLAPALVAIGGAVWLGEPLTRVRVLALGLSFTGLFLVVGGYRPADLSASADGVVLGIVSAACYGAYSVLGKPLLGRYPVGTVLAAHLGVGGAGLVVVKVVIEGWSWPAPGEIALIAGTLVLGTTLFPIALYSSGLRRLPAGQASILATWEPVVATILAVAFLGEPLTAGSIAGGLVIIAAAVILLTAEPAGAAAHRGKQVVTGSTPQRASALSGAGPGTGTDHGADEDVSRRRPGPTGRR